MSDAAAQAAAQEAAAAAARQSTITLWTLYAFGVLVTVLRTYARGVTVGFKNLQGDDFLAWIALLLYSVQVPLGYEIGNLAHGLANNGMTDAQRQALLPSDPEYGARVIGSQIQVAGWTVYSCLIATLKVSMLVFFLRLTSGLGRRYRLRVYVGFGLVVSGFLASIVAIFAACRPFHRYWQINPDPGNICQAAVSRPVVWSTFAANILTDIYLIMIPLPLLWGSSLRLLEKIASSIVLGAGIFVLVCATIKTVYVIVDDVNGAELAGAWGTREAFVAVVTTNLPMVFPLFKTWLRPLFGSALRSTNKQDKASNNRYVRTIGGGLGGAGGSNNTDPRSWPRRGPPSTNPITNVSFGESEEEIVSEIKMENMVSAQTALSTTPPKPNAIIVSSEFEISEDRRSNTGEDSAQRAHEPW